MAQNDLVRKSDGAVAYYRLSGASRSQALAKHCGYSRSFLSSVRILSRDGSWMGMADVGWVANPRSL